MLNWTPCSKVAFPALESVAIAVLVLLIVQRGPKKRCMLASDKGLDLELRVCYRLSSNSNRDVQCSETCL